MFFFHSFSEIEGFLKFTIQEITLPGGIKISQGCLADKNLSYKIELRFRSVVVSPYALGTHLTVRGKVILNPGKLPYFLVNAITEVRKVSNTIKTSKQMLRANTTPIPPSAPSAA